MADVLVIEDEARIRQGVARTLERAGHVVHTVGVYDDALALISSRSFDVALVDYQLHENHNGIDLLRILQQRQPSCARVLVTGHLDLPLAVDAVNTGEIHHVVRKPFRSLDLLQAVEQSVAGHQRRTATLGGLATQAGDDRQMLQRCLGGERFRLALQPIVDTNDGAAVGYEGLIRTTHPVLDGPRTLLRVAQRCQMLPEVGSAVASRAATWMRSLPPQPHMFINVHHDEFADAGALLGRLAPLTPWRNRVVLEITGDAMERWPGTFPRKMKRIRDSGFSIAIDNLGSGRSALNLLAETTPSFIKTDMGIVRDIDTQPRKRRLLDLVHKFAQATGATLVAEGVETPAERDTLASCGVHLMQGYLFGRPGFRKLDLAHKRLPGRPKS